MPYHDYKVDIDFCKTRQISISPMSFSFMLHAELPKFEKVGTKQSLSEEIRNVELGVDVFNTNFSLLDVVTMFEEPHFEVFVFT